MTTDRLNFDQLSNALVAAALEINPAEIQGTLAGLLSANAQFNIKAWLQFLANQYGVEAWPAELEATFELLYCQMQKQQTSGYFSAVLLLPDDDYPLAERAESLGLWCQAFISSFGQNLPKQQLSEMVKEVLQDFAEISLIGAPDDSEESEKLYADIVEFVRLAWLNISSELNAMPLKR